LGTKSATEPVYNRTKLFVLSVVSLVTAGMVFSLRAYVLGDLQRVFFDAKDPVHAAGLVTAIAGVAFLGFAISVLISSPLCDYLGMGRLLSLACLLHIGGNLVIILANPASSLSTSYWVLWFGMLSVGLAHGLVEAVINPLIATLYPEDKTHRLNVLHAWWPGGLVMGGLVGVGLGQLGKHWAPPFGAMWQIELAVVFVPALIYGAMLIGTEFPPTERKAAGVSAAEMWGQALKPLFIVWFLCMFLTASSELAPGQWVQSALTRTCHMEGILLLVYVSMLMFVMRHFAGPLAHKFSPVGLMWLSSVFAGAGLLMLSFADSPVTGFLGATIWGIGVCYMWPTMLGVTSERFPKGGALLLGIMGSAGNFSVYLTLPWIGKIFDIYKVGAAKQMGTTFTALSKLPADNPDLVKALTVASKYSFRYVALLPAVLIIVFGIIWLKDKAAGGYKIEKLVAQPEAKPEKTAV
jgi:MFS family permease